MKGNKSPQTMIMDALNENSFVECVINKCL